MINQLAKELHSINVKNGFYEGEVNTAEKLALVHSEVSEALECDRKGKFVQKDLNLSPFCDNKFKSAFEKRIKDTFEDELADIMIRVMDLAAYKKIDLERHIKLKIRYNSLREYKHGLKY